MTVTPGTVTTETAVRVVIGMDTHHVSGFGVMELAQVHYFQFEILQFITTPKLVCNKPILSRTATMIGLIVLTYLHILVTSESTHLETPQLKIL